MKLTGTGKCNGRTVVTLRAKCWWCLSKCLGLPPMGLWSLWERISVTVSFLVSSRVRGWEKSSVGLRCSFRNGVLNTSVGRPHYRHFAGEVLVASGNADCTTTVRLWSLWERISVTVSLRVSSWAMGWVKSSLKSLCDIRNRGLDSY